MPKSLIVFWSGLFLFGSCELWASEPYSDLQLQQLNVCAQYYGCINDLGFLKTLTGTDTGIPGCLTSPNGSLEFINEVKIKLQACHDEIINVCPEKRSQLLPIISDKTIFLGGAPPLKFSWTDERKSSVIGSLQRKVCSGAISEKSVRQIDNLLFFNATCTGTRYLSHLTPFKNIPGIENVDSDNVCQYARTPLTTLTVTGDGKPKEITSNYITFGADPLLDLWIKPNGLVSLLDETIIHEFVHFEGRVNPDFLKWTIQLLGLRYLDLSERYKAANSVYMEDVNREARRLEGLKDLTDIQRKAKIDEYITLRNQKFIEWIEENQVLTRAIVASPNVGVVGGRRYAINEVDSDWLVTFENGHAKVAENSPFVVHAWSMWSYDEYIAMALAMFRVDSLSAYLHLSSEERSWIRSHWAKGYE